jgi:predicted secreted acid phosphatase
VVLCSTGVSRKEARFRMVEEGGLTGVEAGVIVPGPGTVPSLEVVLWVGDNIHDFPALDQSVREAPGESLEPFGQAYIVLPNPMYGGWARNDWR